MTTPSFTLRGPRLDDAPRVAATHVQAWRETYPGILSDELLAGLDVRKHTVMWERIAATLDGDRRALLVLDGDGDVCGFGMAGPARDPEPPRELELYFIYLLDRVKGTGVGQRLIDGLLGDEPALVWVAALNPRARAFYERNGFRPDGASKVIEEWDNVLDIRMVRPGPVDQVGPGPAGHADPADPA